MIFARYNGAPSEDFTVGKVYLSKPEVNGAETVGFDFLEIITDTGERRRIRPEHEQFEYLEEVYAVVVRAFEDLEAGEVVILDGATENGDLYHMKGMGYRAATFFVLLDRTNVFPGLNVFDCISRRWVGVRQVDECLWVVVGEEDKTRSPSEFSFAVAGDDILTEPIAKCVSATGKPNLTQGKLYLLRGRDEDGLLIVEDDDGEESVFMASRFSMDS